MTMTLSRITHAQGPDSAEWERYRAREYLRDAEADLRVTYDWYRSLPAPGHSAEEVDEHIGADDWGLELRRHA